MPDSDAVRERAWALLRKIELVPYMSAEAADAICELVKDEREAAVAATSLADLYEEIREVKTEVRTNGNRWGDFMDAIAVRYGFA